LGVGAWVATGCGDAKRSPGFKMRMDNFIAQKSTEDPKLLGNRLQKTVREVPDPQVVEGWERAQ